LPVRDARAGTTFAGPPAAPSVAPPLRGHYTIRAKSWNEFREGVDIRLDLALIHDLAALARNTFEGGLVDGHRGYRTKTENLYCGFIELISQNLRQSKKRRGERAHARLRLSFGRRSAFRSGSAVLKWDSATSGNSKFPAPCVVVNPPAALLGVRNAILWGTGKQYHVADFPGPLSIKSVVRGSALWSTSEADRIVDEGSYLVLNSGQSYSITIDAHETVETFCLFFRRGIAEDVSRVKSSDPTSLLDNLDNAASDAILLSNPGANAGSYSSQPGARLEFFETLHTHDSDVSPLIRRIYARLKDKTASDAWLEDQFLGVAAALSRVHAEADKRASRIPAKKHSTRVELYRRLLRGKDYMDSFSGGQVHLDKVAHQACLSPYHFHRLFHQVFRETPNQYLQRKRLATAKRLLERGEQSITNICLEVGFESITSFSGLFRRNFGCSPREYRLRNLALRQSH